MLCSCEKTISQGGPCYGNPNGGGGLHTAVQSCNVFIHEPKEDLNRAGSALTGSRFLDYPQRRDVRDGMRHRKAFDYRNAIGT
jgi:hypothetical protein